MPPDAIDFEAPDLSVVPSGWGAAVLDQGPLQQRLGYNIRQIEIFKNALFEPVFTQHELRPVDYCILSLLDANNRVTQTSIADTLRVQRTNLVRSMARLEGLDYVRRTTDENDKRNQFLLLTKQGKSALLALDADLDAYEAAWTAELSVDEVNLLIRLMRRLYER